MTPEEKEQIKAEIIEQLKAEKKGANVWRKYLKEELTPRLKTLVKDGHETYVLQTSLSQFVRLALNKGSSMQPKESELDKAKDMAEIFIKAYQEAMKLK